MDIEITGLAKTFKGRVRALRGIDLTIPTGMYGLLGPNGAGKTTLIRILAGILRPTAGSVRIGGHDVTDPAGRLAIKRQLGYLPQELGLYPDLSAREFLDYIGILKGLGSRSARQARIDELLDMVALTSVANRKLKTFSGGMKRRVGIAQALLNDPRLLIVDEPTAGLDPEERIRFRNLLSGLAASRTVVLSTHIVEDVAQTAHRLAVLNGGHVLFQGSSRELVTVAQDQVWTLTTNGPPPSGPLTVVSTLHQVDGIQYRVVAGTQPTPEALPAHPSLEDGYVALMRRERPSDVVPAEVA